MTTRKQVEDKIETINDGGNNTAAEVRAVLTDLLNYTENISFPPTQNVEFFHFWTEDNPVIDNLKNVLWYSIKGIKDQWVNITFRIQINNNESSEGLSNNIFSFPLNEKDIKVLEYLKNIMPLNKKNVRFIVPYTTLINEQRIDYPLSTSIYFQENNIIFDFNNVIASERKSELEIAKGNAFSSVSFHCPLFSFLKGKD